MEKLKVSGKNVDFYEFIDKQTYLGKGFAGSTLIVHIKEYDGLHGGNRFLNDICAYIFRNYDLYKFEVANGWMTIVFPLKCVAEACGVSPSQFVARLNCTRTHKTIWFEVKLEGEWDTCSATAR